MSRAKVAATNNEADENEFERESEETAAAVSGVLDPLNNSTKSMSQRNNTNKTANSKKSSAHHGLKGEKQHQRNSHHHHHHHHHHHNQASESNSNTNNVFDWDDYFDSNHRISTNQNIRVLLSNQLKENVSYAPRNISKSFQNGSAVGNSNSGSNLNGSEAAAAAATAVEFAKKKRFEDKLNSYKDNRFQPYMLQQLGGQDKLSKPGEASASASTSSTNLINQDMCIIANLNNFNNNVSNNINSSFINLTNPKKAVQNAPNYLIWDNNVSFFLRLFFCLFIIKKK